MLALIIICVTILVAIGLVVYLLMGHAITFAIAMVAVAIIVGVCASVVLIARIVAKRKNKKV